jgi:hypothetical protein
MRTKLSALVQTSILARAAPPCEICRQPTSFLRYTEVGGKKVGRFAHIRAVSEGGPRYDPDYPKDKIDSPENLFWCCTDCHDIVDNLEKWTLEVLHAELTRSRAVASSTVELIVDGEINVSGEDAENITGIDAGGKTTILKPGTVVNVSGKRTTNITGVKN